MNLKHAATISDLRLVARARLPKPIFDYIDGASFQESTLRRNEADFEKIRFRQRIARDVTKRNIATTMVGEKVAFPAAISPTGISGLIPGGTQGELWAARACVKAGIPYTLPMVSVLTVEELHRHIEKFWFQIAPMTDRALMSGMMASARKAGCPVLIVTMTWPAGGGLPRLARNPNGALPPNFLSLGTWLEYSRTPGWSLRALFGGRVRVGNFEKHAGRPVPLYAVKQFLKSDLSWDDVAWIRDQWVGKIILKGVMDEADAAKAVSLGIDGLSVSNHGGNHYDGVASTISMLPEVVRGANGRAEVFLDGGVRTGQDIVRVCALGGRGVLLGRAHLYGLAAGGESGVTRALDILKHEVDTTVALTGMIDIEKATDSWVIKE